MKWLGVAVTCVVLAGCAGPAPGDSETVAGEAAGEGPGEAGDAPAVPEYREVTLPAGTRLRLELATPIASDRNEVEDAVRATVRQPVVIDGQPVLPVGTELSGVVTAVQRSGRVKGRARIAYRFTSLRFDGERYGIRTALLAHEARATKKKDATKIAVGAGAGAVVGAILGGGSGAAKGAAIGGAGGTGVVLATRGEEVRLGAGADVSTRLEAPLTIRVKL